MIVIYIKRRHVIILILALAILFGGRLATAWTNPTQAPPNGNISLPAAQWTASGTAIYSSNSGNVGIGVTGPGQKLSVAGTIESTSGGFKFPNGSTQTVATRILTLQVFTSSSTWTKPAGVTKVRITVVAGGGGGGGNDGAAAGGGGGAGGGSIKLLDVSGISSSTITVGAGGDGGSAGGNSGSSGGSSSWSDGTNTISATGGGGGGGTGIRGSGGSGSGGDINLSGGDGGGGGSAKASTGHGGASLLGGGGSAQGGTTGSAGKAYGSGGGGGTPSGGGSDTYNGGNGKAGIVIVEEY